MEHLHPIIKVQILLAGILLIIPLLECVCFINNNYLFKK